MSGPVSILAPAKINLVLRVLRRRDDGYHDIDTLFQAVDLCDELVVEPAEQGVQLEVRGAELGPAEENLAHRAARALLAAVGSASGARIRLTKRIPVGAGLGGGSSDAAAVLRGLAQLMGGIEPGTLRAVAETLGSDVPFFVGDSPLARGTGRGEVLEPQRPLAPADFVLVSPPVHVSTVDAYAALSSVRKESGPEAVRASSLRIGAWNELAGLAHNDFEPVISSRHPEIRRALSALESAGAEVALMSGSGSTCFGLFSTGAPAQEAARGLEDETGWPCVHVRSLSSFPTPTRP